MGSTTAGELAERLTRWVVATLEIHRDPVRGHLPGWRIPRTYAGHLVGADVRADVGRQCGRRTGLRPGAEPVGRTQHDQPVLGTEQRLVDNSQVSSERRDGVDGNRSISNGAQPLEDDVARSRLVPQGQPLELHTSATG